jgi:hypothetical protein
MTVKTRLSQAHAVEDQKEKTEQYKKLLSELTAAASEAEFEEYVDHSECPRLAMTRCCMCCMENTLSRPYPFWTGHGLLKQTAAVSGVPYTTTVCQASASLSLDQIGTHTSASAASSSTRAKGVTAHDKQGRGRCITTLTPRNAARQLCACLSLPAPLITPQSCRRASTCPWVVSC